MATAREQLAELDLEFNAAGSTMRIEQYNERRAALLQDGERAAPAPAAPSEVVTEERLQVVAGRLARNIAQTVAIEHVRLLERIAALETRCRELEARGAGVTIAAENAVVPGISELAERMAQLSATLSLPVRPVYDSRGILIGARRVERLDDD